MPSSAKTVVALSGFLGRPEDWRLIENLLPPGWTLHAVDLLSRQTIADFDEWAESFTNQIARDIQGPKVLLGYSMGGRLSLQALAQAPELFKGAVLVSTNPGLLKEDERNLRESADDVWASKFLVDPWEKLIGEWNSQAALRPPKNQRSDFISLDRLEKDFDRVVLAQALKTWTLGQQRNLREEIDPLLLPIELVTGEDDAKFTALASDWMKRPASGARAHTIVSNAAHRVPWDAPVQFRAILAKFLARW